jgi:hypothetical protein
LTEAGIDQYVFDQGACGHRLAGLLARRGPGRFDARACAGRGV